MPRYFLIFCFLLSVIFALPREMDVRIQVPNKQSVRQAQDAGLMVDNYIAQTGELYGVVFENNLPALRALGYPVEVLPEMDARILAAQRREPSGYPTLNEYESFMANVAEDHPIIASLDTFGWSQEGNPLLMLKISNRVGWDETEPEISYISTMHGDEPPGMIFLMWFIDSLTTNWGSDPRITRLVDSCEIFINPLLNPDGYDYGTDDPRRTLSCGVDMNRNFPVPDGVRGNDGTFTVYDETIDIIDWYKDRFISYTINYHTGVLLANYPWDHTGVRSTDDSLYKFLAVNYSSRNPPMYSSPYFDNGITNGFDWYEVDGSLQDWTIWTRGDLHITVELYNTKCPSFSTLYGLWDDNYDAFCAGIENTLNHAVEGIVTDSISGDFLGATVEIIGIEQKAYSSPSNGYYHRLLLPGDYDIKFTCPGYYDKTISVTVPDSGRVRADIELAPMNPIYIYQSDFESDDGGLTTADFTYYEDWEHGTPHRGTIEPYSGDNVWGTELSGEYHDSSQSRLLLSEVTLPDVDSLTLSFKQWYSFQDESGGGWHDGGNIKIWLSPTDSAILYPTPESPGYSHTMSEWNNLIAYQEAYAGLSQRTWWNEVRVNLTPWAGETVDISWDFGSSSVNTQVGWYIDDLAIYYPDTTSLHHTEELAPTPHRLSIAAYPSPFNSAVNIDIAGIEISQSDMLEIEIYSIDGKLIDTPLDNSDDVFAALSSRKSLIWRPKEDTPTGVYLIKARFNNRTSTARIVYLK